MDYETLKEFICLAKYLNFSEAAFTLHISQPTLSRHIANLEYHLDTKLFLRNKSSSLLTLTEDGEMFLEDAQRIIEIYDMAIYRIHKSHEGYGGEIVVGYRRIYNSTIWKNIVQQFSQNYPEINTDYQADNDLDHIYNKLLCDRYDIAFSVGMREFDNAVFQSFELQKSRLLAVLNANHPLALKETVTFDDLATCRLILPNPDNHLGFTDIIIDAFKLHNQDPNYYAKCKTIEDAEFYVATESAVNIVPEFYYIQTDDFLCAKPIEGTDNIVGLYGIYKKYNTNPSLKAYVKFIKQQILDNPVPE